MESRAAFKERADEIGLPSAVFDLLEAGSVDTFGQFAFITPSNPVV